MTNLPINIGHEESACQPRNTNLNDSQRSSQFILKPNQKVYLYDDTSFSGTLIRPVERTYPPLARSLADETSAGSLGWTVELDRGGYDSPTVPQIAPINPQYIDSGSAIPFNDSKVEETEAESNTVELEKEILILQTQLQQLKAENEVLKKDLEQAKQVIRRAKDISPLMRISLKRVLRLAHEACMDVQRTIGGWILKLGDKARRFKRLADIWHILSQDNWYLEDIFPPDKLIAIDLIRSPKPRKQLTTPDKKTFPLMHPSDVMRNHTMHLVKTG